jgi:type VI secretion system protein VasJ
MKQKKAHWTWFAWGKHPALEDFVWAGNQTPLFKRFTKWVDNGFRRLSEDSKIRTRNCSWRFWTRGTGNNIVCGLLRNSCDTHGRSFPLLYIGTGELDAWTRNCSMLPLAFESVWKDVEYVSSARFETAGQLDESLQLMPSPAPDWGDFHERAYLFGNRNSPAGNRNSSATIEEIILDEKRLLMIDCGQPENLSSDTQFCQQVMTMGENPLPMAVFIGEIAGVIAVAMINKALTPDDFVWLWNLDPKQPATQQKVRRG